jgi:hypothetical protein
MFAEQRLLEINGLRFDFVGELLIPGQGGDEAVNFAAVGDIRWADEVSMRRWKGGRCGKMSHYWLVVNWL